MSAFGMKPKFKNREEYLLWKEAWKKIFKKVSNDIKRAKKVAKTRQRKEVPGMSRKAQNDLIIQRAMGAKVMDLLEDAKMRLKRIERIQEQISEQKRSFPKTLGNTTVDFHYNKASNDFADIPMWVVKAKGQTFYVDNVSANAPWSTHNRPQHSTRGMMRFKKCNLFLTEENEAIIEKVD